MPDFSADGAARTTGGFRYADFEGNQNLVALNHAEPAVQDYVTDVMRYWLDRGADGWRLDAAYAVPSAFWRTVTDRVRPDHPDAWLVGEVLHGDYVAAVRDGGLDSVTQYELWKAIWSSLNDRNFRPAFPGTPADLAPDGWPSYRLHQDLIGLRRRHAWLARSRTEVLALRNEALGYLARHPDGGPDLAVLLNLSDDKSTFSFGDRPVTYLLGSDDTAASGSVAPHGWAILELRP